MTTPARVFAIDNRLARVARQSGGKTIEEAVRTAETRVASVRDRCVAALATKAGELAAEVLAMSKGPEPRSFDRAYALGNSIFGVAGTFGLKGLAEAAASLCDLIEGFRGGETVNWPAMHVHVDGIRLLAVDGEAGAEPVLAGLRRVRARFVQES